MQSTLLKGMAGLLKQDSGHVHLGEITYNGQSKSSKAFSLPKVVHFAEQVCRLSWCDCITRNDDRTDRTQNGAVINGRLLRDVDHRLKTIATRLEATSCLHPWCVSHDCAREVSDNRTEGNGLRTSSDIRLRYFRELGNRLTLSVFCRTRSLIEAFQQPVVLE